MLSVTMKFPYQRRKYPTLTDTRGNSSCCTLADASQLKPRLLKTAGSYTELMTLLPKFALLSAPSSLACGMKSPLASLHVRVAVVTIAAVGLARPVIVVRL